MTHLHCALVLLTTLLSGARAEEDAEGREFFEKKIRPVLVAHCYECHSAESEPLQAGLRVDTREALRRGGDTGPAIVPGKPDDSLLIDAVRYGEFSYQMPPEGKLPDDAVADLEKWVRIGAPDPRDGDAAPVRTGIDFEEARQHWAFQPVAKPQPPVVSDASWPTSPIDRFVLQNLEAEGLAPAEPADKRTLIRRVTFDLTGLPPTPAEIADFLADDSPDAYARLVDRLLASPHHGERWARHWLDVVRFAETSGHNRDIEKPNAFRYRDYVVDAFNRDLPYDAFVRENLAGDLLPPRMIQRGRLDATLMATGMLWFNELHHNPVDPVKQRADQVDEQIDVIGKGFLGLTIACARCHDHKFDPIPTTDYYALAGILHSTKNVQAHLTGAARAEERERRTEDADQLRDELEAWVFDAVDEPRLREVRRARDYLLASADLIPLDGKELDEAVKRIAEERELTPPVLAQWMAFLKKGGTPANANLGPWLKIIRRPRDQFAQAVADVLADNPPKAGGKPINPFTVEALKSSESLAELAASYQRIMLDVITRKRYDVPREKQWLNWFHRPDTPFTPLMFEEQLDEPRLERLVAMRREIAELENVGAPPQALASADADDERWPNFRVISSKFSERYTLGRAEIGDVRLHIRGSHRKLGDPVPRGFLTVLDDQPAFDLSTGSGRLQLAERIADPDNPLTARVMVNRIWQHHFGEGLVRTVDNFGTLGERPTHPELLDFLAARFVESGWSIKAVHRLMLLSSTYRMSSRASEKAMRVDPGNHLLQHMPVRRLEAEAIRDAMLAAAGTLDRQQYGPGVEPHLTPFMYPRYRPKSGPIDGDCRRSVYIRVRRNFLPPMLTAFDLPRPAASKGQRDTTTVPSQALVLLNNAFVHEQAARWGEAVASWNGSAEERVRRMWEIALGRLPTSEEREVATAFLAEQREVNGTARSEEQVWTDLAHVLFNLKGFAFVR